MDANSKSSAHISYRSELVGKQSYSALRLVTKNAKSQTRLIKSPGNDDGFQEGEIQNKVADFLASLGIKPNEIKIIITLLFTEIGFMTGEEISVITKIRQDDVYEALASLGSKGM